MPDLPPLIDSFIRIRAWMATHAPGVTLRPPADPAALANFTAKSGLTLPDGLQGILLTADGETRKSAGLIGNWRLLPVSEIQAAWGLLTRLAEKGAYAGLVPETPPYLREAWWHPGWIPVAGSDTGDFFCLDCDPPEPERAGQVLLFLADRPERLLIAASLRTWFDRIARDLEAGVYVYDEVAGFDGEAFLWSALQGKHLLDGREGKLIA